MLRTALLLAVLPLSLAACATMTPEEQAARQEQRAERESMEGAVAEHHASTQQFPAALTGLGAQGAELMIEMPDRQLVGRVVHVGSELVSIVNLGGERFDLAMWAIAGVRIMNTERQPATVSSGHPNSVIARLREAVVSGESLTVSRRFGAPMAGQLRACSDTHVEGVDHNKSFWIVPLPMVTWVASIRG